MSNLYLCVQFIIASWHLVLKSKVSPKEKTVSQANQQYKKTHGLLIIVIYIWSRNLSKVTCTTNKQS